MAPYGAAKAGLQHLARTVAVEYALDGVRMNIVSPGLISTPRTKDYTADIKSAIPLGRIGEPSEIADAVVFMASPLSSFITGQTLSVDGGQSAVNPLGFRARVAEVDGAC